MNQPLAEVPWGAWIGAYLVLTGLASGITLVTRVVRADDERARVALEWLGSWASLATLAICTIILIADLGQPARFFLMVTRFANPGSLMSWGAKIIALKIALLAAYLFLLHRRRQALAAGDTLLEGRATRALYAAVPDALALVSFALAIYPAFLLSWTWSSPAAHNAGSALVYLTSSVLLGAAAVTVIAALVRPVGGHAIAARSRLTVLRLLGLHVVAAGFFLLSLRATVTRSVFDELCHGAWAGAGRFWFATTGLAVVLTVLVLAGRSRVASSVGSSVGSSVASAVAVLLCAAASRYVIFAVH